MSTSRLVRAPLPVLVLALVCLTACGSDDSGAADPVASDSSSASVDATPSKSPTAAESTPTVPAIPAGAKDCSAVWKEGAKLPFIYPGCVDADGQFVKRDALSCSSGQRIVRYDDQYYGVAAGTIHRAESSLEQDKKYRSAVLRCRA